MKYDYLEQSPIRKHLKEIGKDDISIFESTEAGVVWGNDKAGKDDRHSHVRDVLEDVQRVLESAEKYQDAQLKIAVLGEVKAGKSTFINACVGKEIAYMDVLEATAVVSEITYAKEEYARIIGADGSVVQECDFEELIELMAEKVDEEPEYFQKLSKVEIGVDNPRLERLTLVDTPGLLTITEVNQEITNQYIYQADFILWVINSNNLGEQAVKDKLEELKLSGKNMIGIVNKVDSQEARLEIQDYVEESYGHLFHDIFYVSSRNAWRAVKGEAADCLQSSGIEAVWEYLEELAEDGEFYKQKNNEAQELYQLNRELAQHIRIQEDLIARKKAYDNKQSACRELNRSIIREITEALEKWAKSQLYITERTNMLNAQGEELKAYYEKYSSAEYLTNVVEQKYQELLGYIYESWNKQEKHWMMSDNQIMLDFEYQGDSAAFQGDMSREEQDRKQSEGIRDGMKKGAVVGAAIAGYAAWLGPAAATVTLGSALIPCVVPFAIGGAVFGSLAGGVDAGALEENARRKEKEVERLYQEAVKRVQGELPKLRKELFRTSENYCSTICQDMREKAAQCHFSFEELPYHTFMKQLRDYIQLVQDKKAECSYHQPAEALHMEEYLQEE